MFYNRSARAQRLSQVGSGLAAAVPSPRSHMLTICAIHRVFPLIGLGINFTIKLSVPCCG